MKVVFEMFSEMRAAAGFKLLLNDAVFTDMIAVYV